MKTTLERPYVMRKALDVQKKTVKRESLKALAEAIILQSMEDLWNGAHRKESVDFFEGEGFRTCAEMACMRQEEQLKVLQMITGSLA
jgi:hypothetical protein